MSAMFDQDNGDKQEQSQNKSAQEIFEELVGEGKKYSSVEDLAKAYFHADRHIHQLERENESYREQVQKAATVDDILARLNPSSEKPPIQETGDETHHQESKAQPDDVESLVQKALEAKLKERDGTANRQRVVESLKAKYGDAAGRVFKERSQELGLDLEELSARSPQAVLDLFGVQQQQSSSRSLPMGGDTTSHANGKVPEQGTRAYAEYMYDQGKISRAEKYRLLHDFAKDPAQYNKQRTYK